jgi:hypothetical protein
MARVAAALALAGLLAAPLAWGQEGGGRCPDVPGLPARLAPCAEEAKQLDLQAIVFAPRPRVRLLAYRLRLSGVDPEDVRRTLEAYNQQSELATVRRDGVAIAPYLLRDLLRMPPDQLLQVRVGSWNARLVFQFTWR